VTAAIYYKSQAVPNQVFPIKGERSFVMKKLSGLLAALLAVLALLCFASWNLPAGGLACSGGIMFCVGFSIREPGSSLGNICWAGAVCFFIAALAQWLGFFS
jgi:hypothetical protein